MPEHKGKISLAPVPARIAAFASPVGARLCCASLSRVQERRPGIGAGRCERQPGIATVRRERQPGRAAGHRIDDHEPEPGAAPGLRQLAVAGSPAAAGSDAAGPPTAAGSAASEQLAESGQQAGQPPGRLRRRLPRWQPELVRGLLQLPGRRCCRHGGRDRRGHCRHDEHDAGDDDAVGHATGCVHDDFGDGGRRQLLPLRTELVPEGVRAGRDDVRGGRCTSGLLTRWPSTPVQRSRPSQPLPCWSGARARLP